MKTLTWKDSRIYPGLLLMLLLALALRVHRLDGQSLWSDEGLSLYRSRLTLEQNLSNIIVVPPGVPTQDTNPPLYFIALSGWRSVAGESEYALRFLSVIAGVLLVPLLFVTGRRLFSTPAAVLAAALGAIAPFLVWYSQEARMYTPVAALSLASVYVLMRAIDFAPNAAHRRQPVRPRRGWLLWIAWGAITLAALATHFIAFFILPFEAGVLLLALIRARRREVLLVAAAVGVLAVPLLVYGLTRAQQMLDPVFHFRPLDSIAQETWSSFLVGSTGDIFQPWWAVLPGLSILAVAVVGGLLDRVQRRAVLFVLVYLSVPLGVFYAATFFEPLYIGPRHIIFTLPPTYLLLAYGLARLWRRGRVIGGVAGVAVFGLMVWWLGVQFTDPAYLKDDIRSAACTIAAQAQSNDVVVMSDAIGSVMFDYYYTRCGGGAPWTIIPTYPSIEFEPALRQFQAEAQAANRIWYLTGPSRGFDTRQLDAWARGHLLRLDHQRFPSMWLGSEYQLYTAHFPVFEKLPGAAALRDVRWPGAALHLAGVDPIEVDAARTAARVGLYWQLDRPAPFNPIFTLRLVDDAGAEWALQIGPAFDNWSARQWPTGTLIRQTAELELPHGLPGGRYRLDVKVAARQTDTLLYTSTGAEEIEVVTIDVAP